MTVHTWRTDPYALAQIVPRLNELASRNVAWIAILPTWYMDNQTSNAIAAWNGVTASDTSTRRLIQEAHARGIKVMLKPHVDLRDDKWRGTIAPANPTAWFASYRSFILHFAQMAAETGAELFCAGCEFQTMTGSTYTSNWRSVVAAVRQAYPGPITYAANWGLPPNREYHNVRWWDALDYIGINAYVPLTRELSPTVEQARAGWFLYVDLWNRQTRWVDDMKAVSDRYGKQVLFTEIGYQSRPNAGDRWFASSPNTPDMAAQRNCVEAAFRVFNEQPWMVGAFWWYWDIYGTGGTNDTGYSLLGKPAADTLASWYGGSDPDPQPATAAYSFEDGTQGWVPRGRCSGLSRDASASYDGSSSLAMALDAVSPTAVGQAEVLPPDTLGAGKSVSLRAYLPAPSANVVAFAYVQDRAWRWTQGPKVSLASGSWTQLTVTVPATASLPLNRLGVLVHTSTGSFSGTVLVDDVRWDAGTPPPPAPEVRYGFEGSTQGWVNRGRCTGVSSDTGQKYSGSASLALALNAISPTAGGQAEVRPPTSPGAGVPVTVQVYLPASSATIAAFAYVQDAQWRWSQGPTVTLRPGEWTPLTITTPASGAYPLNRLGVLVFARSGTYSGQVFVDAVDW